MTELNPEIWDNPTLGAAANNERLDRVERQQHEDRAAKLENREPREIVVENTYPDWTPEVAQRTGTVPSNYQVVHYADERPNDIPTDSAPDGESAATLTEEETGTDEANSEASEVSEGSPETDNEEVSAPGTVDESESTVPAETQESDSTQWT